MEQKYSLKELDAQIEQKKAEYHEASQSDAAPSVTRKMHEGIKELMEKKMELLRGDAMEKEGELPIVMKKRPGVYEAGHPTNSEMVAQGETAEEAVDNWNNEIWIERIPEVPTADESAEEVVLEELQEAESV